MAAGCSGPPVSRQRVANGTASPATPPSTTPAAARHGRRLLARPPPTAPPPGRPPPDADTVFVDLADQKNPRRPRQSWRAEPTSGNVVTTSCLAPRPLGASNCVLRGLWGSASRRHAPSLLPTSAPGCNVTQAPWRMMLGVPRCWSGGTATRLGTSTSNTPCRTDWMCTALSIRGLYHASSF